MRNDKADEVQERARVFYVLRGENVAWWEKREGLTRGSFFGLVPVDRVVLLLLCLVCMHCATFSLWNAMRAQDRPPLASGTPAVGPLPFVARKDAVLADACPAVIPVCGWFVSRGICSICLKLRFGCRLAGSSATLRSAVVPLLRVQFTLYSIY